MNSNTIAWAVQVFISKRTYDCVTIKPFEILSHFIFNLKWSCCQNLPWNMAPLVPPTPTSLQGSSQKRHSADCITDWKSEKISNHLFYAISIIARKFNLKYWQKLYNFFEITHCSHSVNTRIFVTLTTMWFS